MEETYTPRKYTPNQVMDMLTQIAKFPDILHRTNWIMVGAAGVGKTEILKQLAAAIGFNFMEFPARTDTIRCNSPSSGQRLVQIPCWSWTNC